MGGMFPFSPSNWNTRRQRNTEKHTEKHNILFTSLIFRKMDIVHLREKNSKYRIHLKIYMFFKVDKIRVAVSGVSPAAGNSLRRDTWTIPWSYRLLYRFILFNVGQLLPVTWNQSESVVGGTPSGHRRHCIKAFWPLINIFHLQLSTKKTLIPIIAEYHLLGL